MSDWDAIYRLDDTLAVKRAGIEVYYFGVLRAQCELALDELGATAADALIDRKVRELLAKPEFQALIDADLACLIGAAKLN